MDLRKSIRRRPKLLLHRRLHQQMVSLKKWIKNKSSKKTTIQAAILTNLRFLRFYCEYLSFPMDINPQTGSIRSNESPRRVGGFCVLLSLFAIKAAAGVAAMAYKGLDFNTIQPIFNIVITGEYFLVFLWGYFKLIRHRVTFAMTLQTVVASQEAVTKKRLAFMFLRMYPASVICYTQIGNAVMSSDLSWITQTRYQFHLLFDLMGAETTGWAYMAATVLAIVLDIAIFGGVAGMANLVVYAHISFMEVWTDKMSILLGKWKQAIPEYSEVLWEETTSQIVLLRFFNLSHSTSVFALKVGAIMLSSLCLASLFVFRFTNPLIVFIVMYNGLVAAIGYVLMYQKAYDVKELLEETQKVISDLGSKHNSNILVKRAQGMLCNGIWVGSFQTIERESMLIFTDFVTNQVIDIVLAFNG